VVVVVVGGSTGAAAAGVGVAEVPEVAAALVGAEVTAEAASRACASCIDIRSAWIIVRYACDYL